MKMLTFIIICMTSLMTVCAQNEVMQIFNGKDYFPQEWNDISSISFEGSGDSMLIERHDGNILNIDIDEEILIPSGEALPLIEITTEEDLEEIPNREDYKAATFKLSGFGQYEDVERNVNIRGRGNSSWGNPKKPYRLKFDKKVSLCGLPSAKSYVLLASYTDCSLMGFALATKIGKMLDMPYTNTVIPVDVIFNGIYKGSYILTNKPGINAGSVDIDEDNSIMWELDTYYDEELKFKSPLLDLPVMAIDPDLTQQQFEEWKEDFIEMERAAVDVQAATLVDMDQFAKYLLIYKILKNDEVGWPKSVKLYKTRGGKYLFGPIWDFDCCMGKKWEMDCFDMNLAEKGLWHNRLFAYLTDDPEFQEAQAKYWEFMKDKLPELLDYIDEYSSKIYNSALRNQTLWEDFEDFEEMVGKMKTWLTLRYENMDSIIYE